MRFPQFGSTSHDSWELRQRAQERGLCRVGQQTRIELLLPPIDAKFRSVAQHRGNPGVGVLNVVDRIVVGAFDQQIEVQRQWRVNGVTDQRVASGVHPNLVDQILQGDDIARALGQPNFFATLHHLDQLANRDLDVVFRVIASAGRDRPQPTDVPVVICAE